MKKIVLTKLIVLLAIFCYGQNDQSAHNDRATLPTITSVQQAADSTQPCNLQNPQIAGINGLCSGSSVPLTVFTTGANVNYTFLWNTGETGRSILVSDTGTYSVVAIFGSCTSAVATRRVDFIIPRPKPVIVASGPLAFCQGGSVILSTTDTGAGVIWNNGDTTNSITVTASGTYWVETRFGWCNTRSDSILVLVGPAKPVITANGPLTMCDSGTVTLTGPAGLASYLWNTGDTTQSITVSTAGSYSLTVADSSACGTSSDSVIVDFESTYPKPTLNLSGTVTLCQGDSVEIMSNTPGGWNATGPYHYLNARNNVVYQPGTYYQTFTNSCGTISSDTVVVVWGITPSSRPILAAQDSTFCQGSTTTISVTNPDSSLTYTWSNGATGTSITVSSSGTYNVVGSNGSCQTDTAYTGIYIWVWSNPAKPTISSSNSSLTICSNQGISLTSSSSHSNTWSNGSTSRSIYVTTPGEYYVSVQNGPCAAVTSDTITVVALPAPPVPVITLSDSSACTGGPVTLMAPAGYTYLWSTGDTTQSITTSTTGFYNVIVNNGTCSSISDSVYLNTQMLPAKPVLSVSGTVTICPGDSVEIMSNTPGGWNATGPYIYLNARNNVVYQPGTYFQSFTNSCGTISSDTVEVVWGSGPAVPVIVSSTTDFYLCDGATAQFSVSNPQSGVNYVWNTGDTSLAITVSTPGTYYVTASNGGMCSPQSNYLGISNVAILNKPSISTIGATTFCSGSGATVRLTSSSASYNQWFLNGNPMVGVTTSFIVTSTEGVYTVRVMPGPNALACPSPFSDPITITSVTTPAATITQNGNDLVANPQAPDLTYQWYLYGMPISGATAHTHTPIVTGKYNVIIGRQQCFDWSDSINVNLTSASALKSSLSTHIYPNPSHSRTVTISSSAAITAVRVYNLLGQTIHTRWDGKEQLDLLEAPAGTYLVEVNTSMGRGIHRLVKE